MTEQRPTNANSLTPDYQRRAWIVELIVTLTSTIVPIIFAGIVLMDRNGTIVSWLFGAETAADVGSIYVKATIVLIALVATSILGQRFVQLERIKISVTSIEDALKSQGMTVATPEDCLFENLDLGPFVQSAQSDISLIGINLTSLLGTYRERLNAQLARGRKLTVGIIEADAANLDAATRRSDIALSRADYYRSKLQTSLLELQQMASTAGKAGNGHNIKLVLLPYVPSFSLRGFDLDQPDAVIVVEIYPHRTADSPPMIVLHPRSDPRWFKYFRDQVQVMLRDGKEFDLKA